MTTELGMGICLCTTSAGLCPPTRSYPNKLAPHSSCHIRCREVQEICPMLLLLLVGVVCGPSPPPPLIKPWRCILSEEGVPMQVFRVPDSTLPCPTQCVHRVEVAFLPSMIHGPSTGQLLQGPINSLNPLLSVREMVQLISVEVKNIDKEEEREMETKETCMSLIPPGQHLWLLVHVRTSWRRRQLLPRLTV